MRLNGTIDIINALAAASKVKPPMTINKDLDFYDLMIWFFCGCVAIICILCVAHFLLASYVRFRTLLELPCG